MTLETQMTLALLQKLLMALRANDADGYKSWLALGFNNGNIFYLFLQVLAFQILSRLCLL